MNADEYLEGFNDIAEFLEETEVDADDPLWENLNITAVVFATRMGLHVEIVEPEVFMGLVEEN